MKASQDLLISACGLVTSLGTTALLLLIRHYFGFSFYTLTLWLVIPAGALLCGFAAASGYYLGSVYFNQRPKPLLLLNIIIISMAVFFHIHYFEYYTAVVDGSAVKEIISFPDYMRLVLSHTSVTLRFRGAKPVEIGEIGSLGYAYAVLQIVGFAAGGLGVYLHLRDKPYCKHCSMYFARIGERLRYYSDPAVLKNMMVNFGTLNSREEVEAALRAHSNYGWSSQSREATLMSKMELHVCNKCAKHRLSFSVHKLSGDDWSEIPSLAMVRLCSFPLSFAKDQGKNVTA